MTQNKQEVAEGAQAFIFSSHFCPFSDVYLENQAGQEGGQEGLSPAEQAAMVRKPPQTSHPSPLVTQSSAALPFDVKFSLPGIQL